MICICCGSAEIIEGQQVLWKDLIDQWRLTPNEVAYIDRQQGLRCKICGCNMRSMTLAKAVMSCYTYQGLFRDFIQSRLALNLHILEINEAGQLTQFLKNLPNYKIVRYPETDIMNLPFPDETFDLVVHSDTLEHVRHPVRGLSECKRILKPGGFCAFTVPVLVDRLTASREGLPPSYHGSAKNNPSDFVHTEYGADAWKHVILAGFTQCRIISLEYPASQALVAVK